MLTGSVNAIPLCRTYSTSTLVPCSKFNAQADGSQTLLVGNTLCIQIKICNTPILGKFACWLIFYQIFLTVYEVL